MTRRALLAVLLALGGCGLSERPYAERRNWPLVVPRPQQVPPRAHGLALLLRSLRAGPGLDGRGLQTLQPDGSLRVAFYEEWAVPPAEGVESALRQWLAGSGLFAAVLAPGDRQPAGLVLEGSLTQLLTDPAADRARAAIAIVLIDARGAADRILLQATETAEAPLAGQDAPSQVAAQRAALAAVFEKIEGALAPYAGGARPS